MSQASLSVPFDRGGYKFGEWIGVDVVRFLITQRYRLDPIQRVVHK